MRAAADLTSEALSGGMVLAATVTQAPVLSAYEIRRRVLRPGAQIDQGPFVYSDGRKADLPRAKFLHAFRLETEDAAVESKRPFNVAHIEHDVVHRGYT